MIQTIISALNLDDAIQEQLKEATQEIKEKINDQAKEIANDVCNKLKRESPSDTKQYAKSWTVDSREGKYFQGTFNFVVHNKKKYRITHLLEYGHASRNGGRVKAYPHIEKISNVASAEFERRVKEIAEGTR